jgi:hypothetical protein
MITNKFIRIKMNVDIAKYTIFIHQSKHPLAHTFRGFSIMNQGTQNMEVALANASMKYPGGVYKSMHQPPEWPGKITFIVLPSPRLLWVEK